MKLCWKDRIIACCIILLLLIFCSIIGKAIIAKVVVKHWGVSNRITDFVMEGEDNSTKTPSISIDWTKSYPFSQSTVVSVQDKIVQDKIERKINPNSSPEDRLNKWIRKNMWGYWNLVEIARSIDKHIGWNLYRQNGVAVKDFGNGYLSHVYPKRDVMSKIMSIEEFYQFCQKREIPLLFVQAPIVVSRELEGQNPKLNGYANRNADNLVQGLKEKGIRVLDIRDEIERDKIDHQTLFFKTDHHWTPETALWATGLIAQSLSEISELKFTYNPALLDRSSYNEVVYNNVMLGSEGRLLTLSRVPLENISLFYPKSRTSFEYTILDLGIQEQGDFSIMYDLNRFKGSAKYRNEAYWAYNHGDRAYICIKNQMEPLNGKHIVLIKDSFGDTVAPFLAMVSKQLDVIDLRYFTGSVRGFIKEQRPDAVIILYYPGTVSQGEIQWNSHQDTFDFR